MTYKLRGDVVTLTLSPDDYAHLNSILAFACGAASKYDRQLARVILDFANELNRGNPDFTPYEIVDQPDPPVC